MSGWEPGVQPARDPMVYDVMRETATWLGGEYVARERAAETEDERARWFALDVALMKEVLAVDDRDQDVVRAKTAEFTARRLALPPLRSEAMMTGEPTQQVRDALNFAAGALGAAGHEVTDPAAIELLERHARGEVSTADVVREARRIAGID